VIQASLGEVAHVRDELQTKCDKLAKQLGEGQEELEAVQEESARLMADLSHAREHAQELEGARAGCEQREHHSAQLAAAAMQASASRLVAYGRMHLLLVA
jgi:septal ring factor EnvC (AmiA/AmiB activator)